MALHRFTARNQSAQPFAVGASHGFADFVPMSLVGIDTAEPEARLVWKGSAIIYFHSLG